MKYKTHEDKVTARLEMRKQLAAVARKYDNEHLPELNRMVGALATVLQQPEWVLEYNGGVYDITMKSLSPRYDYFAIYVRLGQYEVRFHDGFLRTKDAKEVRDYLDRKNGEV